MMVKETTQLIWMLMKTGECVSEDCVMNVTTIRLYQLNVWSKTVVTSVINRTVQCVSKWLNWYV